DEIRHWLAFIRSEATFFGVDDPASFALTVVQGLNMVLLVGEQRINNRRLAMIEVFKSFSNYPAFKAEVEINGHYWPNAVLPPAPVVSPDSIGKQLVGKDYVYVDSPQGECNCDGDTRHTFRPAMADLRFEIHPAITGYVTEYRKGTFTEHGPWELRLVYLVTVQWPPLSSISQTHGPSWTFDAMTGVQLGDTRPTIPTDY